MMGDEAELDDEPTWAELCLRIRRRLNCSREALADEVDRSRNTIIHWENGSQQPGMQAALTAINYLGIRLDQVAHLTFWSEQRQEYITIMEAIDQ